MPKQPQIHIMLSPYPPQIGAPIFTATADTVEQALTGLQVSFGLGNLVATQLPIGLQGLTNGLTEFLLTAGTNFEAVRHQMLLTMAKILDGQSVAEEDPPAPRPPKKPAVDWWSGEHQSPLAERFFDYTLGPAWPFSLN